MNRAVPMSVLRAVRQVRSATGGEGPIAVAGARELVPLLAKELRAGGDAAAVTENGAAGRPSALVWVGKADHEALRAASLAGTPIVGAHGGRVAALRARHEPRPHPSRARACRSTEVAVALARVLGSDAPGLAARLPVLRPAVVDGLIRETVRKNALIGAAVFVPGADLPALTLNEALLAVRIAVAGGREAELEGALAGARGRRRRRPRLPAARAGSSSRCRLSRARSSGAAIAFAGTWAVGEALRRRFA